MSERRAQGRPGRGGDEVGRSKIIEGTRAYIRLRCVDISRKELAAFLGVTPALISYYFPERADLIELATRPIVQSYAERLAVASSTDEPVALRLRQTIRIMVEMFLVDGAILECFGTFVLSNKRFRGADHLKDMFASSLIVVDDYMRSRSVSEGLEAFATGALWGICKSNSEDQRDAMWSIEAPLRMAEQVEAASNVDKTEQIFLFMVGGIGNLSQAARRALPGAMANSPF